MAWLEQTNIKGPPGTPGATGPAGPPGADSTVPGPPGQGVPTGGTTGQVLTKTSATDYATNWQTPSGGGGGITDAPNDGTYYVRRNLGWVDGDTAFATDAALTTGLSAKLDSATAATTYAPLASPALTGNPTAPTPTAGDSDTSIATTAFVAAAIASAAPADIILLPYTYSSTTTAPPSNFEIRFNNAGAALATKMWVANLDRNSQNRANLQLNAITVGMLLIIYKSNVDYVLYRVAGGPTNLSTYVEYDLTYVSLYGGMLPANGTNVTFTFLGGGGGGGVTVSDTAPSSPTVGALWWESDSGRLYTYFDSYWVEVGAGSTGVDEVVGGIITIASTAPSAPAVGDVWIDTT